MAKQNQYTSIESKTGLQGLRHRRSMYIGSTGILSENHAPHALTQLSQEILSNSLDEALEGYGNEINVEVYEDNSMSIQDYGRGIPKGAGKSFDDVIKAATVPHASGKFDTSGYQTSGIAGMNGIGVKITNAVSKYLEIEAITHTTKENQDGTKSHTGGLQHYKIRFNQEEIVEQELIKEFKKSNIEWLSNNQFKDKETNEIHHTGTKITFLPDDGNVSDDKNQKVFGSIVWTNKDLFTRFESSAFLNAGLTITYKDNRTLVKQYDEDDNEIGEQSLQKKWYYENGLVDYVHLLSQGQTLLKGMKEPISISESIESSDGFEFSLNSAMMFTDDVSTNIVSFANGVPTKDGGPHHDGFMQGTAKAFNDYINDNDEIKKKNKLKGSLNQSDILEGIIASFELKIPAEIAEFDGQTKEKLSTAQAKKVTYDCVREQLTNWLYDNPKQAEVIIKKMIESKSAREAAIKSRQEAKKARQSKNSGKLTLASKLKPASSRKPSEKEMYITEGDSASNIRRDQKTQAIFPIRGKIINSFKTNLNDVLKNKEVSTITAAIGAGIGPAFELDDMQFHKIVLACFTGDTKVKALDGNSYSFKELVDNDVKDLWVYALNKHGDMVPALAKNIRKTGESKQLVKITLDNGEVIKSTPDHHFMTLDGTYKQANELKIDESLMPLYTKINENGYEEYYDKNTSKWIKTYRRVNEFLHDDERQEAFKRLNKEENKYFSQNNNIQTHHIDENKLNNNPDNLSWLTNREHFILHGKSGNHFRKYNKSPEKIKKLKKLHENGKYDHTYFGQNGWNGSEEHINAVKKAHKEGKYKNTTFNANGYNFSNKHNEVITQTNKSFKHRQSVARSKILLSIKYLQMNNLPFDEYHYNFYRHINAINYDNILKWFDSYKQAYDLAKEKEYKEFKHAKDYIVEYDNNKKQKTQIAKVIKKVLDNGEEFNKETYNSTKGSRTINYDNILKWFDSYDNAVEYAKHINHKIVNIEYIDLKENEDVYCMNVDKYHNFLLDSGIIVKNCDADSDGAHIRTLLITLFYKYFRQMIEEGRLYAVEPPLYKATKYIKGQPDIKMYYSQDEIDKDRKKLEGYEIQRYKGLGEMDKEEAYNAITNRDTHKLVQVQLGDAEEAEKAIRTLMSGDSDLRKDWIEEYIDFDKMYEEQL